MNSPAFAKALNLAWYQLIWFTAVLGGSALQWLLAALVAIHLIGVRSWQRDAALMFGVALLGASLDALLATAGYFAFPGTLRTAFSRYADVSSMYPSVEAVHFEDALETFKVIKATGGLMMQETRAAT